MAPKIHTAAIMMAVEDDAKVLLVAHHPDGEDTMEMEANPNQETTHSKMVPNPPAGTVTSRDIIKKTAPNVSRKMLPVKVSMYRPTGQNKKHHLLEKMKIITIPKEQLVKCTQETWPQCFRVFNEGRSYFPELSPKNIFFQ